MLTTPTGEKRWTAILSTDMVGSTRITQEIGNEKVYELLQHVLGLVREEVEAHGGHVVDTAGDGILAAFGAPRALENASVQVCAAANAFRRRLNAERQTLAKRFGVIPSFRTGIAGGNAMIAHENDDSIKVVGDPVIQATRLQTIAGPGDVLVTLDIQREIDGFATTTDLGFQPIKGFDDPVHIHALGEMLEAITRFDGTRRRGMVGFVSRKKELDQAVSSVLSQERPRILLVSGVAGVGKSRLVHEVVAKVPDDRTVCFGQCIPTGQTPFGPIYEILRQVIGHAGPPDAVLRKLTDYCDAENLRVVLDPKTDALTRALQEREILTEILRQLSKQKAIIFVIEDIHWIDSASNDLLAGLACEPLPLIVTARPTYAAEWARDDGVSKVVLSPLSDSEIGEIVVARFASPVSPELNGLVARKSEGIPLIAEEIIRALKSGSQLVETPDGLGLGEGETGFVTGNLQHLVLARVDRLSASQKAALQLASVIGRDFSTSLLKKAMNTHVDLAGLGDIVEQKDDDHFRFVHALIRDAVYGSLLSSERRMAHGRVAQALESLADTETFARLADHFTQAENAAKAVKYLVQAAQQSLQSYALRDVDILLEQAMQYIEADPTLIEPESFASLAMTWIRALDQLGSFGQVLDVGTRLLPHLQTHSLGHEANMVRNLSAIALTHTRDYAAAEQLAQKVLAEAETTHDALGAAWAKLALLRTYEETYWRPPDWIIDLADQIIPVAEAENDTHLAMMTLYQKSAVYRSSGRRRLALETADKIASYSRTHNDRRGRSYALWARALVSIVEGTPEQAYQTVQDGRKHVIPGSADAVVVNMVELYCRIFRDPPSVMKPLLERYRAAVIGRPDYNLIHSADLSLILIAFKERRLADGWRMINQIMPEIAHSGNVNMWRQYLHLRAELLLILAGLVDPELENPTPNGPFETKKPGMRDAITFAFLRLRWKKIAERDLHKAIALDPLKCGAHFARAHIGLGLIAKSRGRTSDAIKHLETGYQSAAEEGLTLLLCRAERALSSFGISTQKEKDGR
ncbi:Predicted ATPase [Cognatiyoonia koreensis]|uniref:Predicted ATPase n=1 Tax=Cognatiyoonia koreensis TaxID=364200 RepID=A0A1I0RNG7_9RHOB|nr:adenylate/guanylate cyclase domain-containing protein [Cognatiyoonia koreensis]SEW42818.1 Predicted ATPase [Cognatiyoonia koreensis]